MRKRRGDKHDLTSQAGWRESQGWVMANVHVFMIDMLVRVYAVSVMIAWQGAMDHSMPGSWG